MAAPAVNGAARPRAGTGRRTLVLIALAVAAPVLASYAVYFLAPRGTFTNYGELLPTGPMPSLAGTRADGTPFRLVDEKGRWIVVMAMDGRCDATCAAALYATRQARTMQGKDMERVRRVWLVTDAGTPPDAVLAEHPGLVVVRADAAAAGRLPRGPGTIYLVDPLGNQVLAWPREPDIKALAKDLARVLKASRIG
jgi:hypothetical protein